MNFELNEEQRLLKNAVREFAEKEIVPYARSYDEKKEYPWEIFRKAAKLGFIGIDMPEEYGGAGMEYVNVVIVAEELSRADSNVGSAVASSVLGCPMLKYFGNEEQKEKYLRSVLEGKTTSAIAITEPDAGSDVNAIKTRAEKVDDGWVVNGTKTFITNGSISDWIILIAKTSDIKPDYKGMSAFVVETDWEGYEAKPIQKMGLNCHDTAEIFLKNLFIPENNLVGKLNAGFYQLMHFFNESRILVGAIQLGMAIGAYERALDYAKQRKAFGKPLIEHQAIQFKLADMWTEIEAAKLLAITFSLTFFNLQFLIEYINSISSGARVVFIGGWKAIVLQELFYVLWCIPIYPFACSIIISIYDSRKDLSKLENKLLVAIGLIFFNPFVVPWILAAIIVLLLRIKWMI
ncbi:acyl-CoA dehydrogenase [Archaeoglobales archaeon]|nr:MAG: acyl-CoA dehydrogenase [Archaeoglobales archaeon]